MSPPPRAPTHSHHTELLCLNSVLTLCTLQGQLLEIRALMLERLGRHKEALSVYVHELHSMKLAEEYCDRVYAAGVAAASAAAAAPSSSAAAAAIAATAADSSEDTGSSTAAAAGSSGGWGSRRPGELGLNPGDASEQQGVPKWDKVQLVRQQQRQQQQGARRGFGVGADAGKPSWSALPFGGKPQDIYMELVDAVLQVRGQVCPYLRQLRTMFADDMPPSVFTNTTSLICLRHLWALPCMCQPRATWASYVSRNLVITFVLCNHAQACCHMAVQPCILPLCCATMHAAHTLPRMHASSLTVCLP
jgi:hypothetical protein